jgi:hypothetical protein
VPGSPVHTPNNGLGVVTPYKTLAIKLAGGCPGEKTSVLFVAKDRIEA